MTLIVTGIIAAIILIASWYILFGPGKNQLENLKILIPGFNITSGTKEEIRYVGYNIMRDEPKYYDGARWRDINEELRIKDKKIESGTARYYFENYFYRGQRDSLRDIQITNPFFEAKIIGILGPITEKGKNGQVHVTYNLKSSVSHLYNKAFVVTRVYSDTWETICFRFSEKWQWKSCLSTEESDWKDASLEQGLSLSPDREVIKILRNLRGKNFEEGWLILLSGEENYNYENPRKNIFTAGFNTPLSNPPLHRKEIYFKYGNNWQWSEDKTNWKGVENLGGVNELEIIRLLNSLNGKDFDSGLTRLLTTIEDKNTPSVTGRFILKIDDSLLFEEAEDGNYKSPIPAEQKPEVKSTAQEIKSNTIKWRDSVLAKPMPIKFKDDVNFRYYCVIKYNIPDSILLVIDLSNEVQENRACQKS